MFKMKFVLMMSLVGVFSMLFGSEQLSVKEREALNKQYRDTIVSFMKNNKKIKKYINESYTYVVFPSVIKGGALLGVARAKGRAFSGGKWVGNVTMTQYNIGALAGAQKYNEIIFFKTPKSFREFMKGTLEDASQFSLVPIYSGLSANVDFDKDVEVYTSSDYGLMLELSTGLQDFTYTSK